MMIRSLLRLAICSVLSLGAVPAAHAASSCSCSACPGDLNNDGMVSIDELVRAVNTALDGCPPVSGSCQPGGLPATGQSECDQGDGTLGPCPGSPPGQDAASQTGLALSYTDNGDGTVRDNVTGLVWEKLSLDGSIHDLNKRFTWYDAFGMKIAVLNAPPCFAGECDWRLPNRRELESLVDTGRVAPSIDPVFETGCLSGCTVTACSCTLSVQADYYWSSTTYQDTPALAWAVNFNVGIVNAFDKGKTVQIQYLVRAVRGGL